MHGVWQGVHHVEVCETDEEVTVTAYVGTLRALAERMAGGGEPPPWRPARGLERNEPTVRNGPSAAKAGYNTGRRGNASRIADERGQTATQSDERVVATSKSATVRMRNP